MWHCVVALWSFLLASTSANVNLNVFIHRATANFQPGCPYAASTPMPVKQLHTQNSSLSIVDSYKSCLMLSHDVHLSVSGCILVYGLT